MNDTPPQLCYCKTAPWKTVLAALVILSLGSPLAADAADVTCTTSLNNCGVTLGNPDSKVIEVNTTEGINIKSPVLGFGLLTNYFGFKLNDITITTAASQADAVRINTIGSYIFAKRLTATTTGSSADGINVASDPQSPGNDAIVYVSDYANIAAKAGTAVRVNNFYDAGSNSVAILPSGSQISVFGTGTATQGNSPLSSDSYGYGVYAGNRKYDMNAIGASGALKGQNNNSLGNSYAFIGSDSTISTNTINGHAVYANKGGLVQLGNGVNVSTAGTGAYALYAATEQQGSYTDNTRPGYIFLEGGATLQATNTPIVMQANGAGSIIANKAMNVEAIVNAIVPGTYVPAGETPNPDWTYWWKTQQFQRIDPGNTGLLDKTRITATEGIFDVVGIMSAIDGGKIDLNMTDGSIFVGSIAKDAASTVNLNMAGQASKWSINADSTLTTLNLSNGATIMPYRNADELTSYTLTVADAFTNGGIINLATAAKPANSTAGDTFTIKGNYSGNNGTIIMNTVLGDDNSLTDKLVIDGGTATGQTHLKIINAGGVGDQTTSGILVVDAINGATTATNAFALSGRVIAGPYEYSLFRSSLDDGNDNNWYLRSGLDCRLNPDSPLCSLPPNPPPDPPSPDPSPSDPLPSDPSPSDPSPSGPSPLDYRLETSVYTALPAMALLHGRNLLDTLHQRVGEEEDIRGNSNLHQYTPKTGGWGRVIGAHGQHDGDTLGIYGDGGPAYKYNFATVQAGQDLFRAERADKSRDHFGFYFAYGNTNGSVTHIVDGRAGTNKFDAYTLGAYWTHFGPTGWYADAVLQGSRYNTTSTADTGMPDLNTNGNGLAVSLEGGKPFRFNNGYFIEPQAQLIYQKIGFDDTNDTAAQITFSNVDSLTGRIGARLGRTWLLDGGEPGGRQLTAWIRPNLWHEFRGKPVTSFSLDDSSMPFHADLGGSWGEINAGLNGQLGRNVSLFANVSYNQRFDGKGYALDGKVGLRINW